ncbi:MAG: dTMP kinase [Lautropia sp.]
MTQSSAPNRGQLITFEGIDGAGKSTHIEPAAERLRRHGVTVQVTREPGGTALADALRQWLLHEDMSARTEALLAFAARADHVERRIAPALAAGDWVLCDRFSDSTIAYQGGGRGLGVAAIEALEHWTLADFAPDRTYLFDLDPAEAARRRGRVREADRFESEAVEFFERVREAYRARVARTPRRFVCLDAMQSPEVIANEIAADLDRFVGLAPSRA